MPHALNLAALADLGPAAGVQHQRIIPLALILDRVRKPLVQGIGQQVIIEIKSTCPFAAGQRQAGIAEGTRTGGSFLAHDPGARIGSELGGSVIGGLEPSSTTITSRSPLKFWLRIELTARMTFSCRSRVGITGRAAASGGEPSIRSERP